MAITDATEFSTFDNDGDTNGSGVITADTFNEWRKKTNGIINKLAEIAAAGGGGFNQKVIVTNYHGVENGDSPSLPANINTTLLRTTWTSPYSGLARVTCIGGGGAGGSGFNNSFHGSGGGGGEVATSLITLVQDRVYNISIGQGGICTNRLQGAAEPGGDTSWDDGIILAHGGGAGTHGTSTSGTPADGGDGGTGGAGDYLISGGKGGSQSLHGTPSVGGDSYGSGGKPSTTSEDGGFGSVSYGDPYGGGVTPSAGYHGSFGGGGGGSNSNSSSSFGWGGNGAPGAIIIEF